MSEDVQDSAGYGYIQPNERAVWRYWHDVPDDPFPVVRMQRCSDGSVTARAAWDDDKKEAIMEAFNGENPAWGMSAQTRRSLEAEARRKAAAARTTRLVLAMAGVLAFAAVVVVSGLAYLKRFSLLSVVLAALALGGCKSVSEADVYRALVVADDGVTWAAGHEAEISDAVAKAAALDPSDKTLQSAAAKAQAALKNGDLGAAQAFVRSTRIVFSPAPTPAGQ